MKRLFYSIILLLIISSIPLAAGDPPILFTKQINNVDNLYLITSDGKLQKITDHSRKDSSPMASPDGKYIAFTSERVGWWKIWLMNVENNSFKQLTTSRSAEYAPCWSPNGKQIVFVTSRDGNAELYTMSATGQNLRNITQNPANDNLPSWGADNRIYYSTKIEGFFQIAAINPDGSDRQIITEGKTHKYMPQLSPNQKRLLFYSDAGNNSDVYIMNINGSGIQRLTDHPLLDIRPRWSPDGQKIVFERGNKQDNQHIFIMNADGSAKRQLTTADYNYAPSFVSDCRFLCKPGN